MISKCAAVYTWSMEVKQTISADASSAKVSGWLGTISEAGSSEDDGAPPSSEDDSAPPRPPPPGGTLRRALGLSPTPRPLSAEAPKGDVLCPTVL